MMMIAAWSYLDTSADKRLHVLQMPDRVTECIVKPCTYMVSGCRLS